MFEGESTTGSGTALPKRNTIKTRWLLWDGYKIKVMFCLFKNSSRTCLREGVRNSNR